MCGKIRLTRFILLMAAIGLVAFMGSVSAKSLYLLADTNDSTTPIQAYDIQGNNLVFQFESPASGGFGGVGLAIDSDNAILFVTHEASGIFQILDATNMSSLGTVTAPGASDLAGVAFDSGNSRLYVVDRGTTDLYVYDYDGAVSPPTLTPVAGSPFDLTGVDTINGAYGIALDEVNARLYVADLTTSVKIFNTSNWMFTGSATLTAAAGTTPLIITSVAIDVPRQLLYTGGGYAGDHYLRQYDIGAGTTSEVEIDTVLNSGAVGIAVDQNTGLAYASTGVQGGGGTNDIRVFDGSLALLDTVPSATVGGDPTGLAIPTVEISYNPLNFSKTDDVDPIESGNLLTYSLCYDNAANASAVNNVSIIDGIPTGTSFDSATGPFTAVGSTIQWDVAVVAAGAPQVCYNLVVNVTAANGSTIQNSATIDSDETPPTTQTELTTVGTEVPVELPTIFKGKGEGGIASASPLELLFGLLALPLILLRRFGRSSKGLILSAILGTLITLGIASNAVAGGNGWYLGIGAGVSNTDIKDSEYDSDLADLGYTTSSEIDKNKLGWKLFAGYQFHKNWAIEGSYVNLGDVTSETIVSAPPLVTAADQQQFVDDAATVHPYSVDGLVLSGKGILPINDRFSLFAKLGVYRWQADILVECDGCASSVSSPDSKSGTDITAGFGLEYDINDNIGLRGEYERFATDRHHINLVTGSLVYQF